MTARTLSLLIASLLFLTGCGAAPATSAPPEPKAIAISLAAGSADPIGEKVDLSVGQEFTLDITSDRNDEVHVHGFDTTVEVSAGETVSTTLTAQQAGTFEVESHDPVLTILILQIR